MAVKNLGNISHTSVFSDKYHWTLDNFSPIWPISYLVNILEDIWVRPENQIFCRKNEQTFPMVGWQCQSSADSLAESTPNTPICLPKHKTLGYYWRKASLCVRSLFLMDSWLSRLFQKRIIASEKFFLFWVPMNI